MCQALASESRMPQITSTRHSACLRGPQFPLASGGGSFQCLGVRMITRLFSAALRGVDAQEVEVEVNARGADKPIVIIVGKTSMFLQSIYKQCFVRNK